MSLNSPRGFWKEDAREALKPHLVRCVPVGGVGALFSKGLRCQCGRCHVNKHIRKGVVSRFRKPQDGPERIPSIRFGPGLLAELASLVKVGLPIFGLSIVLAAPMFALEHDNRRGALAVTVTIQQEYVTRGVSVVDAAVRKSGEDRKMGIPQVVPSTPIKELVKVPEVINLETPSPPTNLRIIANP